MDELGLDTAPESAGEEFEAEGDWGLLNSSPETSKKIKKGLNQTYAAVRSGQIPSVRIGQRDYVPGWWFRQLTKGR